MKLTKAQRNRYYKKAIPRVKRGLYHEGFICIALRNIVNGKEFRVSGEDIPRLFPELDKKMPKGTWKRGCWWPADDREIRIKVLKACIKETKPKSK